MLLGHIDTVPGEITPRREKRVLYGRGTVDAKGPLAAFVVAAARVGKARDTRITVVGAVEEESATSKGAYHVVTEYTPTAAVIGEPSGWNRITLGYKGRLLVDYVLERPLSHRAGSERTVCEEAFDYWTKVSSWAKEYNRDRSSRFSAISPSLRSVRSSEDGLRERVEMTIGLRLPPGLEPAALVDLLTDDWAGPAQVYTRGYERPFRADKRTPLTAAFLSGIREEGGRPSFVLKTGTSDMNVVGPRWKCPIVAYGPGNSSLDHTPNEHVDLDEYLRAIRVLTHALRRLTSAAP